MSPCDASPLRDLLRRALALAEGPAPYATDGQPLRSAASVYARMRHLADLGEERLYVLALDVKHHVLEEVEVAHGSVASLSLTPADIFRPLVRLGASAGILVHNHPSGDPTPSAEDRSLTRRLIECGALLGCPILDHVVVARGGFESIMETAR